MTRVFKELKEEVAYIKAGAKRDLVDGFPSRIKEIKETIQILGIFSSIFFHQLSRIGFYNKKRDEFIDNFGISQADNEVYALWFINCVAELWQKTNQPKLPSLILDGPVRSGTSTQSDLWQEHMDFDTLQMGMMFRGIALVAIKNKLSPEEVIQLAADGDFHFAIQFQNDKPVFEISCTHSDHQFLTFVTKEEFGNLRTPEINQFSPALNADEARVIEKIVVEAVNLYLEKNSGVVMEGRNLASIIPSNSIRAFYLAVPDQVAQQREILSIDRTRRKKDQLPTPDKEKEAIRQSVIQRNQRDKDNGILLSREEAFVSQKYTAIYDTEKAGPHLLFLSMFNLHDIITKDDLFIPKLVAYLRLRAFTWYSEDPEKSLMHFARRTDRLPGNRALA